MAVPPCSDAEATLAGIAVANASHRNQAPYRRRGDTTTVTPSIENVPDERAAAPRERATRHRRWRQGELMATIDATP